MTTPSELVKQWLEGSPFIESLGMKVVSLEKDRARIELPFKEELVTIGNVVHGGAISSLIDTAAAAAAWSGAEEVGNMRGTTVSLNVSFLAAARSSTVTADARAIRRGKNLCFLEIDATDESGTLVAKGIATYKLG